MLAMVTGEYTIRETGDGEPNKITLIYSRPPAPVLSQYHNDYSEYITQQELDLDHYTLANSNGNCEEEGCKCERKLLHTQ